MGRSRHFHDAARRGVCRARRLGVAASAAAVAVLAAVVGGQPAGRLVPGIVPDAGGGVGSDELKAPPLVYVDDELREFLSRAESLIAEEKYDQAIQILQALIQREDSGFFAEGERRFVSLRVKANDLLGRMGPKGLKLYRALYDPQAQRLYDEAMASSDPEPALRRLVGRYLHTRYGPKALETLGALYFDRAKFAQAAACWQRLLEAAGDDAARAMLLAKLAAAYRLGGQQAAYERTARQLAERHRGATGELGGRKQSLEAFVQRLGRLEVPAGAEGRTARGWGGLGAVSDGLATMSPCDVVLAPRWRRPAGEVAGTENLATKLMAGGAMYLGALGGVPSLPIRVSFDASRYATGQVRLVQGHLVLRRGAPGRPQGEMVLPAMVHPVVAGEWVIVRAEDCVVAYDLLTGEEKWRSVATTNMVRRPPSLPTRGGVFYGGGYNYVGDSGRYALTVGGGRVYTVCDFLPSSGGIYYVLRANPNAPGYDRGSRLAALSLAKEGSLEWVVGREPERTDVPDPVRSGQFLTAPTYHDGRLYVVIRHLQGYHLACLDPERKGRCIWVAAIAQEPAPTGRYNRLPDPRLSVGSPPAVADGRVFVTTNAGVVAAFDAETGQPLWGYQYERQAQPAGLVSFSGIGRPTVAYRPTNPILVSRGRVVCLPADCDNVLALDAATGREVWTASRRDQMDLSAIGPDRLLLSGRGLFVLRMEDGGELFAGGRDLDVWGRPAVMKHAVLASCLGGAKLLDLETFKVATLGLASGEGLLGNLVSADGKLIAANMLGVCSYFSYEVAREQLNARITRARPADRPGLLLQRAELAFDAKRYAAALADLEAARSAAEAAGATDVLARLGQRLYLTHVALGNQGEDAEAMRREFLKAAGYARTDQEKAHMKLRLAKCHERAGRYAEAAKLAQEIAEQFGREELVDVEIGPSAAGLRFGKDQSTVRGRRLAEDYIRKLIESYGRECYAEFDARAQAALEAAKASGGAEAVLAVAERWPNSIWADDALFAAAEIYYRRAAAEPEKADELLGEARRHLYRVARMDDSPLRFSAGMALAMIYARGGWVTSARKECDGLRGLPPEMEVAFADIRGRLGDILRQIEGGRVGRTPRRMALVSRIRTPVRELFSVRGEDCYLLRDQEYRPVRLDEKLAIVYKGDARLLDTTSDDAAEAISAWKAPAGIDIKELHKYSYQTPGMRLMGGLSRDGRVLLVADRKMLTGLDLVTAKVLWRTEMSKVGVGSFYCMGTGSGVVVVADRSGEVVCVDIATGRLLWKARLSGRSSRVPSGPPRIAGQVVIFRHDGGRTVTCFHLGRGGRIVGKWTAVRSARCELTGEGMLLLQRDATLELREAAKIDQPVWQRTWEQVSDPVILGLSEQYVAFSPLNTRGEVEVLSLTGGGRTVATLKTGSRGGLALVPFDAAFRGGQVYLQCTPVLAGGRRSGYGRLSNVRGLVCQKFDIAGRKQLWSRDVEVAGSLYYRGVPPLAVGPDHVVVTARHTTSQAPYYAYILDGQDGRIVQKIDLSGKGVAIQIEMRRRQAIGPPVLTNGRLVVESSEGVVVHGEK